MIKKTKHDRQQLELELSLGERFRCLREARHLSQEDVADQLRLSRHIIEQMESDQYSKDFLNTFMRGYIRNYARLLGISVEEVNQTFDYFGVSHPTVERCQSLHFDMNQSTIKDKSMRWMTLSIIVLLVVLVLIWRYIHLQSSDNSPLPVQSVSSSISTNSGLMQKDEMRGKSKRKTGVY